ncbi:MAG TPA: penicillin-binding protein 2 [Opitutaceae bacterium]|jgi:cell division protein FtsI/penicillin-binding protein 2
MSKGFSSTYRIALLAGLVLTMFAGLEVRLIWLQVVDRDELLRSVDEARRQLIVDNARRGDIVDAKGALLATSHSVIVLGVDPQSVRPEDRTKLSQLASLIGMPLDQIERAFDSKTRPAGSATSTKGRLSAPVTMINFGPAPAAQAEAAAEAMPPIKDDTELDEPDKEGNRKVRWVKLSDQVPESVYLQIEKLGIRGVYGTRVYRRDYPHGEMAAHIIGFVDRDERPVTGIEHFADFYLKGENGWLESERDGRSHELAQFRTREAPASDGFNVVLSIDTTIQRMVEDELGAIAANLEPEKATIIVSDPQTGFVLALANYPTFDPNTYYKLARADQTRMRNIAVADEYEPGSVFKIVAVAGALNDGLVTTQTQFDCTLEKIDYNGITRNLPREDASDHFDHPLSVAEIVQHSSNKGAAQLGMVLGDQRFYDYARRFGFGQRTGFPVGGEVPGKLKAPKDWDSLTITRMPMGQSVTATALQMQQAMSVIANGGTLYRPQIIRQIRDSQGELVYNFGPAEVRRVVTEQTARTLASLLMKVASKGGTAPEAEIPGFDVAGKTGTAQKLEPVYLPNGNKVMRYSERHHVGSFVGFFPANVGPGQRQLAIAVIVDGADARCPGGVAYGHIVAAPSFKRLAERLIPYCNIRPRIDNDGPRALALGGGR